MNKLVKNTGFYAIGQILPQFANFILLPVYTKYLTPNDYGIVSSMVVIESFLIIFFSLSLERSIFRLYWDYKTQEEQRTFLGTIVIFITFFSLVVLGLVFIFSNYVGLIYKSIPFYPFYTFSILTCFLSVFSLVPNIYFMLKEKAWQFVFVSLLQFIISTCLILWFIIENKTGAQGYMLARLLTGIILLPMFAFLSFKMISFKFRIKILKAALTFSLPIIPAIIIAWVLNLSDRVFIERYFSLFEVGVYSLGYKIASIVLVLSSSFFLAFTPMFFKLANSANQILAKNKISRFNTIYIILTLLVAFIISLFSKEIVIFFLDKKYLLSIKYIPILALSYVFSSATSITSQFFQQSKKMKGNLYISLLAAILNVILNFALIFPFGATGAAIATLLSMLSLFIISYIYTKKHCYFVPLNWKKLALPTSLMISILYLLNFLPDFNITLTILLKVGFVFSIGILFIKPYFKQINILVSKYLYFDVKFRKS